MVCLLMMDGQCADPEGTGASAYLKLGRSDEAVMIGSGQLGCRQVSRRARTGRRT